MGDSLVLNVPILCTYHCFQAWDIFADFFIMDRRDVRNVNFWWRGNTNPHSYDGMWHGIVLVAGDIYFIFSPGYGWFGCYVSIYPNFFPSFLSGNWSSRVDIVEILWIPCWQNCLCTMWGLRVQVLLVTIQVGLGTNSIGRYLLGCTVGTSSWIFLWLVQTWGLGMNDYFAPSIRGLV